MPFLKLETNKEYELKVLSSEFDKLDRHWVGSRSFDCTGTGCKYCTAGFPVKTQYELEVLYQNTQYTWTLPEAVYREITSKVKDLKNAVIRVQRTGAGVSTRYAVSVSGDTQAPKSPATTDVFEEIQYAIDFLKEKIDQLKKQR